MDEENIIRELVGIGQETKSNSHRIDKLEKDNEALIEMAGSLRVLATKQESVARQVETIDSKVSKLEKVPADNWKSLIGYIVAALCSAGITLLLTFIIK